MTEPTPQNVSYGDYLALDRLLDAQHPRSATLGAEAHDETLFIITHQTYELWFKQVLHELRSVVALFGSERIDDRDLSTIVHRIDRVAAILRLLVEQIGVLETMTPLDFLDFRDLLVPASGFQSVQFKRIEAMLGLRRAGRLDDDRRAWATRLTDAERDRLDAAEHEPTLHDAVGAWLERMPFLEFGSFRFWRAYGEAVDRMLDRDRQIITANTAIDDAQRQRQLASLDATRDRFDALLDADRFAELTAAGVFRFSRHAVLSALFINLYRDEPLLHLPFRLLDGLASIDEQLTHWRQRHLLMVQRMLGGKIGTGGSSGADYLERTVAHNRAFVDLTNLSTFLIPRSSLPPLPDELRRELGFRFGPPITT